MYDFQPPLQVDDFSGGATDNYIDAPTNQAQIVLNLLIENNKKLISRDGTLIYNSTTYQIPAGNQRIGALIKHPVDQLFVQSARNIYYKNTGAGAYSTLTGPTGNPALSTQATTDYIAFDKWRNHVYITSDSYANPVKIYKDSGGTWRVNQVGLPVPSFTPSFAVTGATNTYLYKFVYYHTYTVGTRTFEVFSTPTDTYTVTSNAPGTIGISGMTALANGATGNYATADIKIHIYRTEAGGTVFYKTGEVTNGTTTFNDTTTDADLQDNLVLYTEGGVLENDQPPTCKFFHVVNNVGYYCATTEDGVEYPNRIRPSKPGNLDSAPLDAAEETEEAVTGVSSVNNYPIIFCRTRMYRVEGVTTDTGQGVVELRDISRTKGCVSNRSIVQIPGGLVFAGEDGFYFTDGYKVLAISMHLTARYAEAVATTSMEKQIVGRYISSDNLVYWGLESQSASEDNDQIWVLDLSWGIRDESTFTMMNNTDSWSPCDIEYDPDKNLVIADRRGYLFKFDSNTYTDPKINTATAPSTWSTKTMIWNYKSFSTTFGSTTLFKFVPSVTLQAKNITNATIQIKSNNDDSGNFRALKEIRFRSNITWGDPDVYWGSTVYSYPWNVAPIVKSLRLFPKGLRCLYKQIQITNAYTNIYRSDDFVTADIDATAKTVTFTGTWPTEIVDYYISFEADGYTNDYLINARNSATVLTYTDSSNLSATATGSKWIIRGYRKGEALNLLSWALNWAPVPQHQEVYRDTPSATGENA